MHRLKASKPLLTLLLGTVLACSGPSAVFAQGEHYIKGDIDDSRTLSTVATGDGGYFELKRAAILPGDAGRTLFFTVTLVNSSDHEISFSDYWLRPFSTSGAQFTAELLPQDKNKNEVAAGNQLDFSFYANVADSTELPDVVIRMTKWDYSLDSLERKLGDIQFTTGDLSYLHPEGTTRRFQVGSVPVTGQVSRMSLRKNEKYYLPQLTLQLTNLGEASVSLPGYQYSLRTADGVMYPLELATGDKSSLQPGVLKELLLKSSTIPASVDKAGWELVLTQTVAGNGDGKVPMPVAFFRVPDTEDSAVSIGQTYDYANTSGLYRLMLTRLQRLPWDEQDLLTADLTVSNQDTDGLPIPELRAYYVLDDGVKIEAKPVKADRQVGLPSGQEVKFKLIGKIPYTYSYGSAKVLIQEKTGDSGYADVTEFELPAAYEDMPTIEYGSKRPVSGAGRNLRYSPRTVHTYTDRGSQLYEVQVEVENTDKRSGAMPKLTAYVRTPEGALYPTKVRDVKQRLNPDGKALVSFWAKLPKDTPTEGLKLVLGDSVTDNHLSATEEKPDAFIDAAVFDLPNENKQVSDSLRNIELYPYTLSIRNIGTWLDAKEVRLGFTYELSKDSYYESSSDGERVILQLEDEQGKITMSQVFYYEKAPGDKDEALVLGEHAYKWAQSDKDVIMKLQILKKYRLSIYHEFQGQRRLVASRLIQWFEQTD